MPPEEKLEKIQEELKQLSQKQLEMDKAQPFFYRLLATNPDLKAIKVEIARLEKREGELYKVIQVRQHRNI
jgi:DNA repair exonuclease SbcCD ATPase subunit